MWFYGQTVWIRVYSMNLRVFRSQTLGLVPYRLAAMQFSLLHGSYCLLWACRQ